MSYLTTVRDELPEILVVPRTVEPIPVFAQTNKLHRLSRLAAKNTLIYTTIMAIYDFANVLQQKFNSFSLGCTVIAISLTLSRYFWQMFAAPSHCHKPLQLSDAVPPLKRVILSNKLTKANFKFYMHGKIKIHLDHMCDIKYELYTPTDSLS